ncbi:AAA family ATPase [Zeaxanthinibacter sp. PT1]|uniref:AAA family ATPase n=1 Tax=Zeaxanthinibacter TaxID=561554 RepID=UPI00234B769B|nr:AAA family ATPase [Zeaxanthinibacter sp. PT1]MDC6350460.1 AAA family ATPase [Zeaxanthinibacter sp. PT1]
MKEKELFTDITKENILKAIHTVDHEGYPSNRKSTSYDLVYQNKTYPPKYLTSLAGYFSNEYFIPHSRFSGGENSACFSMLRDFGFQILPKSQTTDIEESIPVSGIHLKYTNHAIPNPLDEEKLNDLFDQYVEVCLNTDWLSVQESYKLKFGRWIDDHIDFDSQTDEEIIAKCIESQEQVYYENSSVKGVNFIVSNLRFRDHFISLFDVQLLRKLYDDELLENEEFKKSELSYPKFSSWAGTLIPHNYKPYANESLINCIAYLFNLNEYHKSGLKGFNLANTCLNEIASSLLDNKKESLHKLVELLFPEDSELREVDLSWLVQDFILYLHREVLQEEVNYYWVNQGSSYNNELERGIIAAPDSKLHHHKRLKDLKEGDILIHYSESAVRATSVVSKEYTIGPRPYNLEQYAEEDVILVGVGYDVLDSPIPIAKVQDVFINNRQILPKKYSPFTNNLKINQAYCLNFTKDGFQALFESGGNPGGDNVPHINYGKHKNMEFPLNQILYGPPGTGKTYATKELAVRIAKPNIELDAIENDNDKRQLVLNEYEKLVNDRQVVFTTFHQSFSYEDFVEGIKPTLSAGEDEGSDNVHYEIKAGLLKEIVQSIKNKQELQLMSDRNFNIPKEKFQKPINKISLGNSQVSADEAIYQYCIENDRIAIGFGEDINFEGVESVSDIRKRFKEGGIEVKGANDFNVTAMERFILSMKSEQLVFVSNGTFKLRAIGVIEGDYFLDKQAPIPYKQFRPVKWLYTDLDLPIKEIYGKLFSQQTIYQISPGQISAGSFRLKERNEHVPSNQNHILVIDEINRGNVSAIFGELITLIEEDKRSGAVEEVSVTLPYSRESFSIPKNLYIIGTMNTADRSVEALDTALRRRFSFKEKMPNPNLLKGKVIGSLDLSTVLETINQRIEQLIDRDHTIGHSYFFKVQNTTDLAHVFNDKVVPLLQEYFYGDYGKIGLVLGKAFVTKSNGSKVSFADFDYDTIDFDTPVYTLKKIDADGIITALNILLGNSVQEHAEA